jgi:hypothetical protein
MGDDSNRLHSSMGGFELTAGSAPRTMTARYAEAGRGTEPFAWSMYIWRSPAIRRSEDQILEALS